MLDDTGRLYLEICRAIVDTAIALWLLLAPLGGLCWRYSAGLEPFTVDCPTDYTPKDAFMVGALPVVMVVGATARLMRLGLRGVVD